NETLQRSHKASISCNEKNYEKIEKDLVEINHTIASLDFSTGETHSEILAKHDKLNIQLNQFMEKWEDKMTELE
ncbi:MAG: hypothetical protein EBU01_14460, partial [Crocinitomicaceae bacterium]|nr:hypothetical protein [Crocinitomicaceae bacterium]